MVQARLEAEAAPANSADDSMLRNMTIDELLKLAMAEGIDEGFDDAMEAERPEDALVSLIASNRATRDPPMVEVVVPSRLLYRHRRIVMEDGQPASQPASLS